MMTRPLYAELTFGDRTVRLDTGAPSADGLLLSSGGIDGWHSTPDAKVQMTEMQTGDGAHAVEESQVLYAARTVTLHWLAAGDNRSEAIAADLALLATAHRLVRLRVVDADSDTFATGYTQVGADAGIARKVMSGTLTVVCPDPRRYSTAPRGARLLPAGASSGGLFFGADRAGLVLPLSFGEGVGEMGNVATLANRGTSPAYPVITVTGPVDAGLRLDWGGGSLSYDDAVRGVPLVLDCLTRTASVGGLDTSRHLTSRGFPEVPPGGSITLSAQMTGSGWAVVEWRDTYI